MRILAALALLLFLGACTSSPSPDQIRRDTAKATANAKADTKAVADGIKEGLHKGDANSGSVDINSASKDELMHLPGITDARAERIIAARPYRHPDELVSKKVLTQGEYDRISGQVTTH
ncbi:MAG TPA: helix-hairpin-helix domain-containing protein [Candidatus Koribacter sp.]|jgi:DNA uptake protein ComE-like DNA-binding protein